MRDSSVITLVVVFSIIFCIVGMACGTYIFRHVEVISVVDENLVLDAYDEVLQEIYGFKKGWKAIGNNIAIDPEDVEIIDFGNFVKFLEVNGYEHYYRSESAIILPLSPRERINCFWVPVGDAEYFWRLK